MGNKTNISFWLNDNETIQSIDIEGIIPLPFKIGDKLWFDFEEISPAIINNWRKARWKEEFIQSIEKNNEESKKKYHLNQYKIKRVNISMNKWWNNTEEIDSYFILNIEYKVKKCLLPFGLFHKIKCLKWKLKKWFKN